MPNEAPDLSDKPVLTIVQRLKDGSLSPAALTKDQRQQCVGVLLLEGYSPSQIAQLIDRSEKTVKRDIADIGQRNALNPSPDLARQLIGSFLMKVEAHQTRLMRLARGTDGSVGERAQAELSAWKVLKESTELLQSLGYLPLRPQQIVGDVVHHVSLEGGGQSLDEVSQTLQEITTVGQETNTLTPEIAQRIQALQSRLEQAKLSHEAKQLLDQQQLLIQKKEISNDEPQS